MFEKLVYNGIPIKFYPYQSSVRERFIEINSTKETKELKRYLIKWFNENGIKCYDDNKIVFEITIEGKSLFVGFYDGVFSMGFSVYSWD